MTFDERIEEEFIKAGLDDEQINKQLASAIKTVIKESLPKKKEIAEALCKYDKFRGQDMLHYQQAQVCLDEIHKSFGI